MEDVLQICSRTLNLNWVRLTDGDILVAGAHQFRTYWVRDFCYAVPALLLLGHAARVRGQLDLAVKMISSDGLIPRGFDVVNPKLRVVATTFGLPATRLFNYENKSLKPEYHGEHGTPAIDSNLLTLLAGDQLDALTGDGRFFAQHGPALERAYRFVLNLRGPDGLIRQPGFSDWQDSARREGATFYTNLLFLRVLQRLQRAGIAWAGDESLTVWKKRLWEQFFDSSKGLFRSQLGRAQFSLETQLWCIEENLFADFIAPAQLWENLKSSELWKPCPGRPVWPDYPSRDVSWTTKLVGLRHYHDQFYWSWLMGESLKVASLMGDAAQIQHVSREIGRLVLKHQAVHEIFEMTNGELAPVRRLLYRSEVPFSWGTAKVIEGLSHLYDVSSCLKTRH